MNRNDITPARRNVRLGCDLRSSGPGTRKTDGGGLR